MRKRTASSQLPRPSKKKRYNPTVIPARPLVFQRNTVTAAPERKNVDVDLTLVNGIAVGPGSQAWSPTITLLNGIAQGATEITRVGRKCQLTKISFNWTSVIPPGATGGCCLRFKIVYDKQTNGAAPTILQVFSSDNFHAPNNLANADRFITLVDHITPPLSIQGDTQVSGKVSRKLNLETIFGGSTSGIASITSGSVYLFVAQSGGALASSPNLQAVIRTRFIDI